MSEQKKISFLDLCVLQFMPCESSTDNDGVIETTVFYKVLHGIIYIVREEINYL